MIKCFPKIIAILLAVFSAGVGFWAGHGFVFSAQVQLLRELREVSTIIFGIMGAWSAIVYPEELKRKLRPTEILTMDSTRFENFHAVMRCLIFSGIVVCAVLAMQFAAPIVASVGLRSGAVDFLRRCTFALGCVLAFGQIWLLVLMLIPINSASADIRALEEAQSRLREGPQGKVGTRRAL